MRSWLTKYNTLMKSQQLKNFLINFSNQTETNQLKKEIFDRHSYYFESELVSPLIFDLGAHIGISTLYFKMLYPQAKIIAVEPNPKTFELLKKNIEQNKLEGITLLPLAVSNQTGTQSLHLDIGDEWYSTASFTKGAWTQDQPTEAVTVKTTTLAELITGHADHLIDFVKMDIEGAEFEVLLNAGTELKQIKELIVEYHPLPGQDIQKMITHLKQFGLTLESDLKTFPKKSRQLQMLEFVNHKHSSS